MTQKNKLYRALATHKILVIGTHVLLVLDLDLEDRLTEIQI